jgi:phospholipid transport system substrate-binding protein
MKVKNPGSLPGWGLILALAVNLTMWVPGARAAGPLEDVKSLIEQVQTVLQGNSQKGRRLELIEKLAARHLDFQEIAQRCLGSTWGTLSADQQSEFVRLISRLLMASYAHHLDDSVKAKVNYLGESSDGNHAEVRLVVIRPDDRMPVNFRLLQKPEGWMIYDLNIEGESMVSKYRRKFQRAIQFISYQGLVGRLKEKLKAEELG